MPNKFSDQGIPILTMQEKLKALAHCLEHGYYEDAAGHLCDLLEYCRQRIQPSSGAMFSDLEKTVRHYGERTAPIDETS